MKTLRFIVLTSLAVFLFLLSANLAPPAEAGGLPGTDVLPCTTGLRAVTRSPPSPGVMG